MKNYFITMRLYLGEYEKYSNTIVGAETQEEAKRIALEGECHNEPSYDDLVFDDSVWDGMEFIYRIYSIKEIQDKDLPTLNKYLYL